VLIPDFRGREDAIRTVVESRPEILAHNIDTVERLMRALRPGGKYWRSISLLGAVKRMNPDQLTKSAIILGMGETEEEIYTSMKDLREAAVDILTLGQYLRPSQHHVPLDRWVTPEEFRRWKEIGESELGFRHVEAGPLVRSSYHAKEQAREVEAGGPGSITQILDADLDPEVRIDAGEAAARAALVAMPPVQPKQLVQIGSL
jgi:lipoic acid synthetase